MLFVVPNFFLQFLCFIQYYVTFYLICNQNVQILSNIKLNYKNKSFKERKHKYFFNNNERENLFEIGEQSFLEKINF